MAGSTAWTFYDLTFASTSDTITTSTTGSGDITVSHVLTINGTNTVLNAGNRAWILSGAGTPFVIANGSSLTGNTSTFRYTGAGATAIAASTGYNTLQLYPGASSATFTLASGTFTMSGDFIAGGNSAFTSTTVTLGSNNPTLNITGDFTVCASSCPQMTFTKSSNTITLNGTANTKTITDNNTVKQDLGNIAVGNGATAKTINMGSSITLTSLNVTASATFSFNNGAYTLTINGTGTPLTKTGTFTTGSNGTTTYTGNGATNITAATYNNLQVFPGGASATHTFASGTFTVTGNLDIGGNSNAASTVVTAGANNPTIGLTGNLTICATTCSNQMTFTKSSNTLTINGTAGTVTLTDNNPTTKQDLGALAIGNASAAKHVDLGSSIKATSINVTSSATLDSNGSNTITLTGTTTPLTLGGAFTYSTGTVVFTGDADLTIPATTYYNLTFSPTITDNRAYTFRGALAINNGLDLYPDAASPLALTVNLGGALTGPPAITIRRQNSATSNLSTSASNYGITAANFDIQAGGTLTGNASTTITSNGAVTIASGGALSSTSGTIAVHLPIITALFQLTALQQGRL